MKITFDFRGLRRFVGGIGGILFALLFGAALGGLAWLLKLWLDGWLAAGLSLLLLAAVTVVVLSVQFERKDQVQEDQGQEVHWRTSKPGRRTNKFYDMAFEFITSGEMTEAEARAWYFQQEKLVGNESDIKNFNERMRKRRQKQRHENTK